MYYEDTKKVTGVKENQALLFYWLFFSHMTFLRHFYMSLMLIFTYAIISIESRHFILERLI